jgi:hypothetical protein
MARSKLCSHSNLAIGTRAKVLALVTLAIAALSLSGCPALMISGLAYSGYQYEKTGKLPGMPTTSHDSSADQGKASSQATPSNSIE